MRTPSPGWLLVPVLLLAACGDEASDPFEGFESAQYADLENWLCHPEKAAADDVCDSADLDVTAVAADGSATLLEHAQATDPAVDCFYVYPTVSLDPEPNSDLVPSVEETFITAQQAARFNQMCRVFAPMYRQVTLTALISGGAGADRDLAYGDVRDAFAHYIANVNDGRGVLLLGHSQGSGVLRRLIQEEIEPVAALRERMIGAYLIGTTVAVPPGEDAGGSFDMVPLCRAPDQTGCVVTYASYRETVPPTPGVARFGDTEEPGMVAGCTNPAALMGGGALLEPYFPTSLPGVFEAFIEQGPGPYADPAQSDMVTTAFFGMPGFIEGECVQQDGFNYLEIRVMADPADPRADDIGGDFQEGWGLHVVDVSLAMGDLVALAERQAAAWLAR